MRVNTLYLKYAVEVERTRSITQAAENLYMAQPNLSKAIKELEDSIGIDIFERTSKGVAPTAQGLEFLRYAKNVLVQIDKIEALGKRENKQAQELCVAIAGSSYIAEGCMEYAAGLDMTQEMDVRFCEMDATEAIHSVAEGNCRLGIIQFDSKYTRYFEDYLQSKGLESEHIWTYAPVVLMHETHPLAAGEEISETQLTDYAEICGGMETVPYVQAAAQKEADKRQICVRGQADLLTFVSGIPGGYAYSAPVSAKTLKRYGLVQRKVAGQTTQYHALMIYGKGHKFTGQDKEFINKIYNSKNSVAFRE